MNYITQKSNQGIFFDYCFDKNRLKKWITKIYDETILTEDVTIVNFIENLKTFGFNEATKAGISIGIDDLKIPPQKRHLLKTVEYETQLANDRLQNGAITPLENFQLTIDLWHKTNETIKGEVVANFEATDTLNPVYMMAFSGARGNLSQVTQLLGMRGFMSDPEGQIIDFPIRSNFREGLTLTEYIISCYGARKGLVDTALRTADAGYLTRRLVDVAHSLVITIHDCKPKNPTWLAPIYENNKIIYPLEARLVGRVLADDIYINYIEKDSQTIIKEAWPYFKKYKQINQLDAKLLGSCFKFVKVRSPLSCNQIYSLCQLCYGWTLPHSHLAPLGEAVGIIAAQSIGEPGTQLTMRTFHTGGVFSGVLSDEILAPYSGIIEYNHPIIGAMFRLANGKLGFLTREAAKIKIKPSQNDNLNQPIFEMNLPEDSILFLKNHEKVEKNQLLLELPKEKDDDNETLLNEYTYYSKTSGLLKLEEAYVHPQSNYYPDRLYKQRRFKRRSRNILRGTNRKVTPGQAYIIRKNKTPYVYYTMQDQNQKYNSVKIYQGEICYGSTLTTLPQRGDLINRNSLVSLTELTHPVESKLTKVQDLVKKATEPKLKLEKKIFNFNFTSLSYKAKCGYITSTKYENLISVSIQSLNPQFYKGPLKINLIPNAFFTKTNGKIFWNNTPINSHFFCKNDENSIQSLKRLPNSIFWLSEPVFKDFSNAIKCKTLQNKSLKDVKTSKNFLITSKKNKPLKSFNFLQIQKKQNNLCFWLKKGEDFSFQKTQQGLIRPNRLKFDSLIKNQPKQLNLEFPLILKRQSLAIRLKQIKTGWPYLGLKSCQTSFYQQKIYTSGEKIIHDIYNNQHTVSCDYYSSKYFETQLINNCLNKLNKKYNIVKKTGTTIRQFYQKINESKLKYVIFIRLTKELYFPKLSEQAKLFQLNFVKNEEFHSYKQYQYLNHAKFFALKFFYLNKIFNQINRQSTLLTKISQLESWVCRFEQNTFLLNSNVFYKSENPTFHHFLNQQAFLNPRILAHLSLDIRANIYFGNTQEKFESGNIFTQNYQGSLFEFLETDPFFIKKLHSPNHLYCASKNSSIPQHFPILKNFFLSSHNGEIFNNSNSKYASINLEFQLRQKLKLKASPGSTILTSNNSFTNNLEHKNRKWHIGKEIYRGLDLGNKKTSVTNGQIIYLTKNGIKCQRIDKFIMSTNSKFFCQNDQLILKNTRLYTDFYPRLQMGDIVQGIPKIEEFFEARRSKKGLPFEGNLHNRLKERFKFYRQIYPLPIADRRSINDIQTYIIGSIFKLYSSQGINISDKHLELIVRQMTAKVHVIEYYYGTFRFEFSVMQLQPIFNEYYSRYIVEDIYWKLLKRRPRNSAWSVFRYVFDYEPVILGITQASLESFGFISAASFQETTRILTQSSIIQKTDYLKGLKENVVLGHLIPAGTALQTRLKHGPRKVPFRRKEFKVKISRLLVNRCLLDSKLDYKASSHSCQFSYKKSHKFINPVLYLFLYIYCVYYVQPKLL